MTGELEITHQGLCTVDGCGRTREKTVFCNLHYTRWRRYGDVNHQRMTPRWHPGLRRKRSAPEVRFWNLVDIRQADECWPWKATRVVKGYGRFNLGEGHKVVAHRLAYRLTIGPIPKGMWVLHDCDNPPCCNPRHLSLGDPQANSRDMVAKGRARGSGGRKREDWKPYSKLTETDIPLIRMTVRDGMSQSEVARRLGIHSSVVCRIVNRKVWRHVP